MNGINVLDWTGGPFLMLYIVLYAACLVVGRTIARNMRPEGHASRVTDADELALLANGRERVGEVIVARMLDRGALVVERGKLHAVAGHQPADATEAQVMALPAPISWKAMRQVTDNAARQVERRLVSRGLMMEEGLATRIGLTSSWPLIGLMLLGVAKAVVGSSRGHAVGFLVILLLITGGTVLFRWMGASQVTDGGKASLAEARATSSRLKLAHTGPETAMAVALFGTAVLATSSIGDFHRMRAQSGDGGGGGDGGGDSGSDGGGGGCGGGGCGGCGG